MKINLFRKTIQKEIAVIDWMFPQKEPFGFRNIEINEYFSRTKNIDAYTMYPMKPWGDAWFPWSYGLSKEVYGENINGYLAYYPDNKGRIHYIDKEKKHKFKLAYSFFLAETYVLLPFLERNKIPFVFILYPGGTFGINNQSSDNMLRRIFQSKYFRGVIVTQKLTKEYVLQKKLCDKKNIHYIYGGFSQITKDQVQPKRYYKKHKNTFDVCFIAGKYTEKGIDKGYDLFVETAKILSKKSKDIRFHVVGGFQPEDMDLGSAATSFTFYGFKPASFFPDFFAGMDIFLSPNRPGALYEGNFDGFPLGLDAPFCGVASFVSDELSMNRGEFTNGENIVIIPLDAKLIAKKITYYMDRPDKLYELGKKGKAKAQNYFDIDFQIKQRMKVIDNIVKIEKEVL